MLQLVCSKVAQVETALDAIQRRFSTTQYSSTFVEAKHNPFRGRFDAESQRRPDLKAYLAISVADLSINFL